MARGVLVIAAMLAAPLLAVADAPRGSVEWWEARLADRLQLQRRRARTRLIQQGPSAVPILKVLSRSTNPIVRREAAMGLGSFEDRELMQDLFRLAFDGDPSVVGAAASGLILLGDTAHTQAVARERGARLPHAAVRYKWLASQIMAGSVERKLHDLISSSGGWGFWENQFAGLKRYLPGCIPVLIGVFTKPGYGSVLRITDEERWEKMRLLAGKALGQLGRRYPSVKYTLEWVIDNKEQVVSDKANTQWADVYADYARAALFHLGYPKELEKKIERLKYEFRAYSAYPDEQARKAAELAGCFYDKRDYVTAETWYRKAIELEPKSTNSHYNLACVYSLQKKLDLALEHLTKAIDLGYEDLEYIMRDGDLINVRKHPKFEAQIINHAKLNKEGKKPK